MLSGLANCGWLKALKNSAGNWRPALSTGHLSGRVFETARSRFACPGPSTIPAPTIAGGRSNAIRTNHRWGHKAHRIEIVVQFGLDRSSPHELTFAGRRQSATGTRKKSANCPSLLGGGGFCLRSLPVDHGQSHTWQRSTGRIKSHTDQSARGSCLAKDRIRDSQNYNCRNDEPIPAKTDA